MFSCVNDKESEKISELRRNIIYMLGSLEISSTFRLGGGWGLKVGMPASQECTVRVHPLVTVGMEGKVWVRDPGREMHRVSVSS